MPIVVALFSSLLLSALSAAIVLVTSIDTMVAENFRYAHEAFYAADAVLERALLDLSDVADVSSVLAGTTQSAFVDGPPAGIRTLPDGSLLDLEQALNMRNCRKVVACSASELSATTLDRPWGANNPVWRLFAHGGLGALVPSEPLDSPYYVIVFVGDDPSENDDDPLHDGSDDANPGAGILVLRAEAFGPRGAHQAVEVTAATGSASYSVIRVLSWRRISTAP